MSEKDTRGNTGLFTASDTFSALDRWRAQLEAKGVRNEFETTVDGSLVRAMYYPTEFKLKGILERDIEPSAAGWIIEITPTNPFTVSREGVTEPPVLEPAARPRTYELIRYSSGETTAFLAAGNLIRLEDSPGLPADADASESFVYVRPATLPPSDRAVLDRLTAAVELL